MPETGGPTTQSGIFYQNSVAALYLAQLCTARPLPAQRVLAAVRVESPSPVDDILVTYVDGGHEWIHVKETVRKGDEAWQKVWRDFGRQFWDPDFQRDVDRLVLCIGEFRQEYDRAQEISLRASSHSDAYAWQKSLSDEQESLLQGITAALLPGHTKLEDLHVFFRHMDVVILPPNEVERRAAATLPDSNVSSRTLFRLLRDRVAQQARVRPTFVRKALLTSLEEEGLVFSGPPRGQMETPQEVTSRRQGQQRLVRDVTWWCGGGCLLSATLAAMSVCLHLGYLDLLFSLLPGLVGTSILLNIAVMRGKVWASRRLREKYQL